jgi:filamentous hemagglutinin family protein
MNKKRFRLKFSKRLGMLIAVAENRSSQRKSSSSKRGRGARIVSSLTATAALALLTLDPSLAHAQALPTNGQVVAGQAAISQNANTMNINQGSQRAVINWDTFNVGQGNTVQFNQPNAQAQAQALNRVVTGVPSNIQGTLLANGQVLIQNANGVLFGKGAVVNVGSLLASMATTIMSSRFLGTPSAHQKREMLLRWLPERLAEIEEIDALPMGVMHDMYMHCSYADLPGKHDIKKPINALIRRKLASLGIHDVQRPAVQPAQGEKPVLLVVLEWFSKNHSIYRTHSQTMVAMRDKFHLIGMGYNGRVDDVGKEVFHEFIPLEGANLWETARHVRDTSEARNAQMMYMPSVGMFPITMVLACLRVAPLQMMALGHPATTHGHAMDYVVVEEDYVGDEACFSEKLLKLPSDGMPYRAPAALLELQLPEKQPSNGVVKIAVAGTTIKQNPGFLNTCAQIANESKVPVEFHFLMGQANGLIFPQVRNLVRRLMGDKAVVHKHQNYGSYMKVIAGCDLFLNPFPFGNTNGIVDTVWAGLVGVCKTGREVHEHIDEGMFRRLGFPEWMVAKTNEEYKASALRLIENPEERHALAAKLAGPQAIEKLIFKGRPEILGERMQALWQEQAGAAASAAAA